MFLFVTVVPRLLENNLTLHIIVLSSILIILFHGIKQTLLLFLLSTLFVIKPPISVSKFSRRRLHFECPFFLTFIFNQNFYSA